MNFDIRFFAAFGNQTHIKVNDLIIKPVETFERLNVFSRNAYIECTLKRSQ